MTESLWGDEAFSALAVMKSFPEMIGVVMRDTAPPLFILLVTGGSGCSGFRRRPYDRQPGY